MTDPTSTDPERGSDSAPITTLSSLPNRLLERSEYKRLEQADAFDNCGPLLDNRREDQLHAFSFRLDGQYYYIGWNPSASRWEQLVRINTDPPNSEWWTVEVIESAENDGTPQLTCDISEETMIADIHDYIWEYLEHVHDEDETDHLWYIPHTVEDHGLLPNNSRVTGVRRSR